jgi:type II secretory pathway pseudopilin PulG
MRLRPRIEDETGMTLIELTISMSLLVIIIVPVTTAFLLGILESTSARERVADSSTAQAISAFLMSDIQSAKQVYLDDTAGCASPPTDDTLLQTSWVDPRTNDNVVAAYFTRTEDGQRQLFRVACTNGTAGTPTQLAHNLRNSGGFEVTCTPACSASATTPTEVKVHVEAESIEPRDNSSYEPFEFDLEATRRVGT